MRSLRYQQLCPIRRMRHTSHMPDTAEVNGVTLRRPFPKTEINQNAAVHPPLNNETWAANYIGLW